MTIIAASGRRPRGLHERTGHHAGSSSLKYQLLDTKTREVFAKGNAERIGIEGSFIGHEEYGKKDKLEVELPDHRTAIKHIFDILATVDEKPEGIGHRVVQGGWYFPESAVVTDETLGWVREVAPLAPLHNYAERTSSRSAARCSPSWATSSCRTRRSTTTCPSAPGATPSRATWWIPTMCASTAPTARATAISGAPLTSSWAAPPTSS